MNYTHLNKLTLVIFTLNRHKLLKRTINYWLNFNIKLIVLDGSNLKFQDPCLQSENIKYIHDKTGLYRRLLSSINYINTEFVILGSDDEFYLPSALASCIDFLLKESNFSSCGGRAIGFYTEKNKIFGLKQYKNLKNLKLDQSNASERAIKHFSNYVPAHFYSVMRFSKWKIICQNVFEKNYHFSASHELQVEFLSVIAGKSRILPELMWLRNKEIPPIHNDEVIKIEKKYWWYNKKYKNEKLDFLKRMKNASDELTNDQNIQIKEETIIKSFEAYLYNPKLKETYIKKIRKLLPSKIKILKRSIISLKNKYLYNKHKSLIEEINLLELENIHVNHTELNQVISSLRKPVE